MNGCRCVLKNGFFESSLDPSRIRDRLLELENGKVGFYSVGLYPISLAYNCAMQTADPQLLLAPRPGRVLLGAFSKDDIAGMDPDHLATVEAMFLAALMYCPSMLCTPGDT